MGYEHSMLTSSDKIEKFFPTYKIRLEHKSGFDAGLNFAENLTLTGGNTANGIKVTFSTLKSTSFTYDAESGRYSASQFDAPYKDGNNGEVVTFANVIVLNTRIAEIKNDPEGRLDLSLTGSGTGRVAIGGVYVDINWSKKSSAAPFVFTDSSGNPLILRAGRSFIAIIGSGATVTYK
jgi:hypothetical protein